MLHHKRPRLLQYDIVDVVTDSKSRAGIAGCRLHKHLAEWSVEQNLSVHHRVICDSAGQTKSIGFRLVMQLVQNVKANFLQACLERSRDVLVERGKRLTSYTRRTEGIDKLVREDATNCRRAIFPRHVHAFRVVLEVVEVQFKADVIDSNNVSELFEVTRTPIGRKPHHLSFVSVLRESQVLTGGGINNAG